MVEDPQPQPSITVQGPPEQEITRYPWYVKEIKKMKLGRTLKFLGIIIGVGIGIYLMFHFFSWYPLIGLVLVPAWYFWALRQIDRDAMIVIECRLQGDKFDNEDLISTNTETNIYSIPPDIWKETKKYGAPFMIAGKIVICDKLQFNELGEPEIIFSHSPEFSNLNFYSRLKIWLSFKEKYPVLLEQNAIYRWNIEALAQERALTIMEKITAISDIMDEHSTRREPIQKRQVRANHREPDPLPTQEIYVR